MTFFNPHIAFMQDEMNPSKKIEMQLENNLKNTLTAHTFSKLFSSLFSLNAENQCVLPATNVPMTIAAIIRQSARVVSCDPHRSLKDYIRSYENAVAAELNSLDQQINEERRQIDMLNKDIRKLTEKKDAFRATAAKYSGIDRTASVQQQIDATMHGMRTTLSGEEVAIRNPFVQFTRERGQRIQNIIRRYITLDESSQYNFMENFATQLSCAFNPDQIRSKRNTGRLEVATKQYVENQSRDALRVFAVKTLCQKDEERRSFHERELQFVEYARQFMVKL